MNASETPDTPIGRFWPHALALLATVLTWPLLMVGGTVTVYRVGMAVYDWPTTFGVNMFVYNMFEASWGVFAEHAHRLYGSVVGMSCILLACWYTVARLGWKGVLVMIGVPVAAALGIVAPTSARPGGLSPVFVALGAIGPYALALAVWFGIVRRDVRLGLAWLALALVVVQGFLGGYRVTLNSTTLAFVHGCLAQAFFALLVSLVVLTGRKWKTPVEPGGGPRQPPPPLGHHPGDGLRPDRRRRLGAALRVRDGRGHAHAARPGGAGPCGRPDRSNRARS